jgi:hypothetical protein
MEPETISLYMNWPFWAVVVSATALLLSQLPPIHILLKKAKIDFELYSRLNLTHKVGNPILQLHMIINNIGGKKVRVKAVEASITRDGGQVADLPTQNFLQDPSDKNTVLFTSFSLEAGQEWGHIINLFRFFGREEEREYRQMEGIIKEDIFAKRNQIVGEVKELVEAHPDNVAPFHAFFKERFIWTAGEYELRVNVITDVDSANAEKLYRFTIFEYYEEELRKLTDEYKNGAGIYWDSSTPKSVTLELKEA